MSQPSIILSNMYALDIETDTSGGNGLDPQIARITTIAFYNPVDAVVFENNNEKQLLLDTITWLKARPSSQIVTWNGSAFDGPYMYARSKILGIESPFTNFTLNSDSPKYKPLSGFTGCYDFSFASNDGEHTSIDIAYKYKAICESKAMSWSLKAVAKSFGIGVIEVDRENMHKLTVAERLAYNFSDVVATYMLASNFKNL